MKNPGDSGKRHGWMAYLPPVILALPAILYFVYCTWLNPISPFYANYDPEFPYLMNSLEIFKGKPYAYVDHPGTPLEIVGTAIYAVTFPALRRAPDDFIRYHLENPGLFLTLAHGLVELVNIAGVWYVYSAAVSRERGKNIAMAAAVAGMYFAIHPLSYSSLLIWSHNSFAFATGTSLLVFLYGKLSAARPPGEIATRPLIIFGLGAGFMTGITVYLAAWIVGGIAIVIIQSRLCRITWRKTLAAAAALASSSLAGFSLAVLPAIAKVPSFFVWIKALLAHENRYLMAPQDVPLSDRLATNFFDLYHQLPVLAVSTGMLIMIAILGVYRFRKDSRMQPTLYAFIPGLIFQIAILTGFILDHPKAEYMLSVAATLPVLTIAVLDLFEARPAISTPLSRALAVLVWMGILWHFSQSLRLQTANAIRIEQIENQTAASARAYAARLKREPGDLYVLWSYRSYAPCFSLWFGNDSTGRVFRREIGELCYRESEFHVWSQKVISAQGVSSLADAKWDLIIGCEDGFEVPALASLAATETFPSLKLECGALKIAYNDP